MMLPHPDKDSGKKLKDLSGILMINASGDVNGEELELLVKVRVASWSPRGSQERMWILMMGAMGVLLSL
ncbi:hypothetical protein L1987_29283 [Smallanthus sonchifolius]|uniref:Uncharacterized protein n=1 Tax=Smallanthus sonchifolius TaxID=185202 RepID=A0ACB9HZI4_9ASTR|nr:hypothetical protein L1987_29283 [Smallanthus sonchifolius]